MHINSKKQKNRGRHISSLISISGVIFVICISVLSFGKFPVSAHESADDNNLKTICYNSYLIKSGDTLWDIAEDNMPNNELSTAECVQIIKDINGLDTDEIQSGQYLILPY